MSDAPPRSRRSAVGRTHECDVCGTTCPSPSKLVAHMRTHTGERPYKCDVCHAAFTASAHVRAHTVERLYKCDVCHAAFIASGKLSRHTHTT